MGIEVTDELLVEIANKPGALADALGAVAKAGVAVRAYCAYGMQAKGWAHIVAADAKKAAAALKKAGLKAKANKVVLATIPDKRGAAAKLAAKAAKAKVNLEYSYASGTGKGTGALVFAAGKATAKLAKALGA